MRFLFGPWVHTVPMGLLFHGDFMRYKVYWSGLDAYIAYKNRPPLDEETNELVFLRIAIQLYIRWWKEAKRGRIDNPGLYCLKKADTMRRIGLHFYYDIVFLNRLFSDGCKRYIAYTFRRSLFGYGRSYWKVEYVGDKE